VGSIESAELSWSADLFSRAVIGRQRSSASAVDQRINAINGNGWSVSYLMYSASYFIYGYIIGWPELCQLPQCILWSDLWIGWSVFQLSSPVLTVTRVTW